MAAKTKKKALSNTERQKKYRLNNSHRVNIIVSSDTKSYLSLLAAHYCVTKRRVLERILEREYASLRSELSESELEQLHDKLLHNG